MFITLLNFFLEILNHSASDFVNFINGDQLLIPSELFAMWILFTVNILGLSGVETNNPSLLLPWLVIYLKGFLFCYLIIFSNYYYGMNIEVTGLIFSALLFNCIWIMIFSTYSEIGQAEMQKSTFEGKNISHSLYNF